MQSSACGDCPSSVRILLNDETESINFKVLGPFSCGPGPLDLSVGDVDGVHFDDVVVVNAYGAKETMLTNRSSDYGKAVAHAGSGKVAATSVVKDGNRQIFVVDTDSAALPTDTQVTTTTTDHGEGNAGSLALYISGISWNPDGTKLYFQRAALGTDPAGIYLMRIE